MRKTFVSILAVLALCAPCVAEVLLIPDSSGDKIWAFDPFDGSVLSEDYIPADGNMIQPINVVDSGRGTLLVSDENADAVLEYALTGELIQVVANSADGLDALQGIAVRGDFAYVGSRTAKAIFEIDLNSGNVSTWAADAGTPRDIVFRENDALVTNSDSESSGGENIERYDLDGNFIEILHDSDGVTGIDFPQQLKRGPDGGIVAAGFSAPRGLYGYDGNGNQLGVFDNIITSPRGIHVLGNGMLLYAGGTRVMRYDPATLTEATIVNESGRSFRYIELSTAPPPIFGDVNRDGKVNVLDLLTVWLSFGECTQAACLSDLDQDGDIDEDDLLLLREILGLGKPKEVAPA